jgi:N-carbamoyl-L-amino-acid hydrolase
MTDLADRFAASFGALADIGKSVTGYRRFSWTEDDAAARRWFLDRALELRLTTEVDGNGNLYAWWGDPGADEVVLTGSHLDTVADGGAFDGALGVVSAFLAVEELQESYKAPTRPIGVATFVDEEGARFGVPTIGSRLATGALKPEEVLGLTDTNGVTWEKAMRAAGADPTAMGATPGLFDRVAAFVELHIEQGRGLVYEDQPVGVISRVWPHGRWRFDIRGASDHAGTARLRDRRDPALVLATAILAARNIAAGLGARATVGRMLVAPNTTNVVAERATVWLDARAADDETLDALLDGCTTAVQRQAEQAGVAAVVTRESYSGGVTLDDDLSGRVAASLESLGITPTSMATAAGHDAAILSAQVPAAMLHVRNVTGVSHCADEQADVADCIAGARALSVVLENLACG